MRLLEAGHAQPDWIVMSDWGCQQQQYLGAALMQKTLSVVDILKPGLLLKLILPVPGQFTA